MTQSFWFFGSCLTDWATWDKLILHDMFEKLLWLIHPNIQSEQLRA